MRVDEPIRRGIVDRTSETGDKLVKRALADVHQDELLKHDLVKKTYGGKEFEIPYIVVETSNDETAATGRGFYAPFNPRSYECVPGIICEQDVACKLRDGTTIYSDIYRPKDQTDIPVIVEYTSYGKRPWEVPQQWQVVGTAPGLYSKYTAFECADPTFWCPAGYAVAVVDSRGAGCSEGDMYLWGEEYGEDTYDYIEWVAEQWWCNGKVTMAGNSALAMVQWCVGALNPPHLACLAPWEGCADFYREFAAPGAVLNYGQYDGIFLGTGGAGRRAEDYVAAYYKYPLFNEYWESKRPKVENIKVPVYVTAGWSHQMHLRGSLHSFCKMRTKKWLRCHREFEWVDFYSPQWNQDLKLFFDRYCKDIHNGWEVTPKVRIEVMDAYDYDYVSNRPENEFPLARTQYTKFYLNAADGSLNGEPILEEAKVTYEAKEGITYFEITFEEDTEITGFIKAHLWVEADGSDDMDVFVTLQKYNAKDEWIPTLWAGDPHPGTFGILRASHRELDEEQSTDAIPVQTHKTEQLLEAGEIVPLEIEIWPTSKIWHKGEKLRMSISGYFVKMDSWWLPERRRTRNEGTHIIHTGGQYDSFLQVPIIPPKYVSGDYIYR